MKLTTPTDQLDIKRETWEKIAPFINLVIKSVGSKLAATHAEGEDKLTEEKVKELLVEEGGDLCNVYFQSLFLDLLHPNNVTAAKQEVADMRNNLLMDKPEKMIEYMTVLMTSFIEQLPAYIANVDAFDKVAAAKPSKEVSRTPSHSKICESYVITTYNDDGEEQHTYWSGQGRRSYILQKIFKDPVWVTHASAKRYITDNEVVSGVFPDGSEWQIATSDAFNASHEKSQ